MVRNQQILCLHLHPGNSGANWDAMMFWSKEWATEELPAPAFTSGSVKRNDNPMPLTTGPLGPSVTSLQMAWSHGELRPRQVTPHR